jgi:Rod binding domain-containing protein
MKTQNVTAIPGDHPRIAELKRAAQGIETMFIKLLVTQLRKDGFGGFFGGGTAGEIYADFADQAIAETIAKGRGVGIAEMIRKTLEPRVLQRIAAEGALRERANRAASQGGAHINNGGME